MTIRFQKQIDSETLTLPELRSLIGRNVEFVITTNEVPAVSDEERRTRLHGTVLKYEDPFGPACPPEDWEALQ